MTKKTIDPWQAEDDARTLKRYSEITSDKNRMSRATKILKQEKASIDKVINPKTGGKKK